MNCPVCKDAQLVMTERQGLEIDYCPTCRGVWLDRGELDKIIERSTQEPARPGTMPSPQLEHGYRSEHDKHGHDPHRKKSIWGELFD